MSDDLHEEFEQWWAGIEKAEEFLRLLWGPWPFRPRRQATPQAKAAAWAAWRARAAEEKLAAAEARFSSERAQYEITIGLLEQAEATIAAAEARLASKDEIIAEAKKLQNVTETAWKDAEARIAAMQRDWEILTQQHERVHEAWEQSKARVLKLEAKLHRACERCGTRPNLESDDAVIVCDECMSKAEALLDCRAGKLLKKGKRFVVVTVDEPYFASVFATIRETEKAKGRWTAEDEAWYLDTMQQWVAGSDTPFEVASIQRLRGARATTEARCRELEQQLAGMTEVRNRFNHYINEIGRLFQGDDKQCYAPDAVLEWVREQTQRIAAKNREIERLRGIIYRNCSSVHCAAGDSRAIEDIVMAAEAAKEADVLPQRL